MPDLDVRLCFWQPQQRFALNSTKYQVFPLFVAALPMRDSVQNIMATGNWMRTLFTLVTATAFKVSSMAWADGLAPGKAAGVQAARWVTRIGLCSAASRLRWPAS